MHLRLQHLTTTTLLTLLLLFPSTTLSARTKPTSFCKCICFNNSTIIPLNSDPSNPSSPSFLLTPERSSLRHNLNFNLLNPFRSPPSSFPPQSKPQSKPRSPPPPKHHHPQPHRRQTSSTPTPTPSPSTLPPPHRTLSCTDCNRAFCLSYNLPICTGATDADIFTTCFQRDSVKDEVVIFVFLITTTALLGWALVRPWVERVWGWSGFGDKGGGMGREIPPAENVRGGGGRRRRRDGHVDGASRMGGPVGGGGTGRGQSANADASASGSAGRYDRVDGERRSEDFIIGEEEGAEAAPASVL